MPTLRNKLIECGYWKTDDPRDPAVDADASSILLNIMREELSEDVSLRCLVSAEKKQFIEVFVVAGNDRTRLARAGDLHTAICKAALVLPDFLKRRPEFSRSETAD